MFWTYLVPFAPMIIGFDGLVSCLRTYTPVEMLAMAEGLDTDGYVWQSGEVKVQGLPVPVTYLIGHPGRKDEE